MTKEMLPEDGFTLQSFSLGRPLRGCLLFFWVIGAVVIDDFSDAICLRLTVRGGAPAAVDRYWCRIAGRFPVNAP